MQSVRRGFVDGESKRQDHAERDRHVHIESPRAQGAQRALEERLTCISDRRQSDQSRKPVEQVARLLSHVGDVAGPDRNRQQHHVHGGKASDRQASQQPPRLGLVVGLGAFRRERMGAIADSLQRLDDARSIDLIVAPIDGEPPLGKVQPRVDHAWEFGKAGLDLADAAGAGDALDRECHMRRAGVGRLNEHR